MCRGVCSTFEKKPEKKFHYCQGCSKRISEENLFREKKQGRYRCKCCNGLVRVKYIIYKLN